MSRGGVCWRAQLTGAGVIDDTFALCFGGVEGCGALLLGDVPPPPGLQLLHTPLLPSEEHPHYYIVELSQIAVSGEPLVVPQVHPPPLCPHSALFPEMFVRGCGSWGTFETG